MSKVVCTIALPDLTVSVPQLGVHSINGQIADISVTSNNQLILSKDGLIVTSGIDVYVTILNAIQGLTFSMDVTCDGQKQPTSPFNASWKGNGMYVFDWSFGN